MVLVTMGLFFLILTTFTILVLLFSNDLLIKQEEKTIRTTANLVQRHVSDIDEPLNKDNLIVYLQTTQTLDTAGSEKVLTEGMAIAGNNSVSRLLYSNQIAYLYNTKKELLFTTSTKVDYLTLGPLNKLRSERIDQDRGFTISVPIYNKSQTKVIGYAKLFHNLEFYYALKNRLIIVLLFLEVGTIIIVLVIMRFSIEVFLKPIYSLRRIMRRIEGDPTDLDVRAEINSGDEIEELSHMFNAMMARIAEQNKLQQQFISDVSHELRTPVAVIKGHLDMLSRWGKNDPEILEESLEASRHEAHRMNLMISDMLDLIRLQGNLSEKTKEVSRLESSMQVSLYNFEILRPDFQFALYVNADDVYAKIAKNHFEQVLTILIDNAIKYSPHGGLIELSLDKEEGYALVTVKDHGEGIAKEDLQNIFERFYRTDKSRNREGTRAGLGIGLSILKQICDAYDCRLSVESEVNVQTTFTIAIPLGEPSPEFFEG
ncbi:sensor histidine kinase [Streptococcus halotolerans]|uniref:sensor histidine kinase n=1 Tax=Streptococcus halotolerans TaxID=1814128 RepID=UPI000B324F13|nr:HAMP domain-containing histidine kinase [Streptococcus halotolerans]